MKVRTTQIETHKQQDALEHYFRNLCQILGAETDPNTLTAQDLYRYAAERRQETFRGRQITGQTIRKELQALKSGLKIAKRRGWVQGTIEDWPQPKKDPALRSQAGKLHAPEIVDAWLEELGRTPKADGARDQAELDALLGLRAAEIKRLQKTWLRKAPPGFPTPGIVTVPDWAAKNRHRGRPIVERPCRGILAA